MPKVVFFDIGGVLVSDPFDPLYASLKRINGLERHEVYARIKEPWRRWKNGEIDELAFWDAIALIVSAPPSKAQSWRLVPYAEMSVLDGAKDVIRHLHQHNLQVGIISNMSKEWGDHIFSKLIPKAWFSPVVLSCDVGLSKPGADIFEKARRSAKSPDPGDCLFLDNGEKNVEAAKALGWDAVMVNSIDDVNKALEERGLH